MRRFSYIFILSVMVSFCLISVSASHAAEAPTAKSPSNGELWSKRCQDVKDKDQKTSKQYCEIFQRLSSQSKDGKTYQRVTEFAVGYPPGEKTVRAVIVLPLGILVQETMSILIDEKNENHFHVQYCLADGCYATLNLPKPLLETITKGNQIMIKGKTMAGQPLHIILSLTGFGKAVAGIKPD